MKLTNRAKSALATAGYSTDENSAIAQLVAFAAQNSGIDPRNYFSDFRDTNGRRAFNSESRSISEDWRRFKAALIEAANENVTDTEVIIEAPHAFSGRLEWTGTEWNYCTGQYFPTEYRKAAATLLEYAIRRVRQARTPQTRKVSTIAELRALSEQNGGTWFDRSNMRFFGTKIESGIIRGKYFITSEQQEDHLPRKFTVRSFDEQGKVGTVGKFHSHDTKESAVAAIPRE